VRRILPMILFAACGGGNPARERIDGASPPSAPTTEASWTCPMHPEVHAAAAGPCPICGMPLVPAKAP
jgi:hypothetical protein